MDDAAGLDLGTAAICASFLVVVAPVYLLFRYFVSLVRQAYGFTADDQDDGPALRVCPGCHTSVLETDVDECLSCGTPLPPLPEASEAAVGGDQTE